MVVERGPIAFRPRAVAPSLPKSCEGGIVPMKTFAPRTSMNTFPTIGATALKVSPDTLLKPERTSNLFTSQSTRSYRGDSHPVFRFEKSNVLPFSSRSKINSGTTQTFSDALATTMISEQVAKPLSIKRDQVLSAPSPVLEKKGVVIPPSPPNETRSIQRGAVIADSTSLQPIGEQKAFQPIRAPEALQPKAEAKVMPSRIAKLEMVIDRLLTHQQGTMVDANRIQKLNKELATLSIGIINKPSAAPEVAPRLSSNPNLSPGLFILTQKVNKLNENVQRPDNVSRLTQLDMKTNAKDKEKKKGRPVFLRDSVVNGLRIITAQTAARLAKMIHGGMEVSGDDIFRLMPQNPMPGTLLSEITRHKNDDGGYVDFLNRLKNIGLASLTRADTIIGILADTFTAVRLATKNEPVINPASNHEITNVQADKKHLLGHAAPRATI